MSYCSASRAPPGCSAAGQTLKPILDRIRRTRGASVKVIAGSDSGYGPFSIARIPRQILVEPMFKKRPNRPGLAHYIIHAYDAPLLAPRGLDAARRYASIAPVVPHALHVPSHTFTRVGYQQSIDTNRKSAEAARKAGGIAADGAYAFALAAIPARYALERQAWAEAAALTPRAAPAAPYTEAITHFARAIGAARSGNSAAAMPSIERLAAIKALLVAPRTPYWAEQVTSSAESPRHGRRSHRVTRPGAWNCRAPPPTPRI